MLASIFTLQGRIGRLAFCLGSLLLTIFSPAILLAVMVVGPGLADPRPHSPTPYLLVAVVALILAIAAVWLGVALHVRRIRDIGWSPRLIVAGWLVFRIVDAVVPFCAASNPLRTGLVVVDYGFWLVLLLLPGRDGDGDAIARKVVAPPPPRPDVRGHGAPRLAQASFGRRGLN